MEIREYQALADFPAIRTCLIELQEFERALDPRLPPGSAMADSYLEELFRRCDRFAGQLFVVEAAGLVVGFVSVLGACRSDAPDDPAAPFAYVDDLVVLPHHRGLGYGRALLERAEAYAAAQGQTTLRLRAKGGNKLAREFYARAGYGEYEVELEKQLVRALKGLLMACGVLLAACHPRPPARADIPAESQWTTSCDTVPATPSPRLGGTRGHDRDSLLREVQARRAAWRAHGITDYRVRIAVRCFCPFSPPAILEVRGGIPVALRDSIGRRVGEPREPYTYTIEGLFDLIERAVRNGELVEVSYAPCLGYPASVGVDPKGLDNWYVVTADHLMTPRQTSSAPPVPP